MEAVTRPRWRVTDEQLREAEEGLRRVLLAKRFRSSWIAEHLPEIMAQARTDFAARLAVERVEDTVNLLVVIAYRRALKLVSAEIAEPHVESIEIASELADEKTPTPEEEVLELDRHRRLLGAMSYLPDREKKLLAFVYFEEMELQEAGRRLGWAKASATRHHQAALEKLRALVGDRNLLGLELGVPAYVAAGHRSAIRSGLMWVEGAAESVRDAALVGSGRVRPFVESGNAVAASGAGRTTAGVCAVAVGCIAAATGVVGPGIGVLGGGDHDHARRPSMHATEVAEPVGESASLTASPVSPVVPEAPPKARTSAGGGEVNPARGAAEGQRQDKGGGGSAGTGSSPPMATTQQTINEFGVEHGEGKSSSGESSSASSGGSEDTAPARAATPSGSGSSSGASGSQRSSGRSEANSEFGM